MQFKVKDIEDLKEIALVIEEKVSIPANIILKGELGAGKTTFVRKFCELNGVEESVSSPTYVLQHEYKTKDFLIEHWDLYRVSEIPDELYEFSKENTIRFVEWGDKFKELESMSEIIVEITIEEKDGIVFRNFKLSH